MREIIDDDIAIIGYAFDFPDGVDTNDKFWDILKNGKSVVREIPKERWDWRKIYDADPNSEGKSYSYHGAFLNDLEKFDANAFRIMPIEAKGIDPQQRLALKTAWYAMENSFLNIESLKHSDTGVFIGATMDDYLQLQTRVDSGKNINRYTHFGSVLNDISGRVSYVYGFQGPSMTIDTACSSSFAAIDSAIKALKEGDCSIALAGGVNVILTEEMYIKFSRTQMLSKTGACKTFDDSADGYVRGEGCGILVLQKLKDAQASGKRILAVIRGCCINHNGNSGGLTVPSGKAQELLIKKCMKKAGVEPNEIDYIEAHGTGTQLGDKIEVSALQGVFKDRESTLYIGSVKSNIGHLESAAGVAGIIKMLLCMENNEFVPSINLKTKNKKIKWDDFNIDVLQKNMVWNSDTKIAGISAFGASGTNGHIIIQKYDNMCKKNIDTNDQIILAVSSKNKESLKKLLVSLFEFVKEKSESEIRRICQIYNLVRSDYNIRIVISGTNKKEFIESFNNKIQDISLQNIEKNTKEIHFLCNFDNGYKKYKQFEKENVMYQYYVSLLKNKIECKNENEEELLLGIAFYKFLFNIGFKNYKIIGNNNVKYQIMLASDDNLEYEILINKYLNKEPEVLKELAMYENNVFVLSNNNEVESNTIQSMLLDKVVEQYEQGARIKWNYLYTLGQIDIDYLPRYEFDENDYWIDNQMHLTDDMNTNEILHRYIYSVHEEGNGDTYEYVFKLKEATDLVEQHKIYEKQILIGTFHVKLICEIMHKVIGKKAILKELSFVGEIEPELGLLLKVEINKGNEYHEGCVLEKSISGQWEKKVIFIISESDIVNKICIDNDVELIGRFVEKSQFYDSLFVAGLVLGKEYQIMTSIIKSENTAIALIENTNLEPAILDSASQLMYLFRESEKDLYMPYYFESYNQWDSLQKVNRVEVKMLSITNDSLIANLMYYAEHKLIAQYTNYRIKLVSKNKMPSLNKVMGRCVVLPDGEEIYNHIIKMDKMSLRDHVVYHRLTIPGAYFISQVMQFAKNKLEDNVFELSNINFYNAMVLEENMIVNELIFTKQHDYGYDISICSARNEEENYIENVKMVLSKKEDISKIIYDEQIISELKYSRYLSKEEIVKLQWKIGLHLGKTFNWIQEAWINEKAIIAKLENILFDTLEQSYGTPVGLIDTAVQILGLMKNINQDEVGAYIPMTIDKIVQYQKLKGSLLCSVYNVKEKENLITADILYYDPQDNKKVLEFQGITLMKADKKKFGNIVTNHEGVVYKEEWLDYHLSSSKEKCEYNNALNVRLGVLTNNVIITWYKLNDNKWTIYDKKIYKYEDKHIWSTIIIDELNKNQNLLYVLSDSSENILINNLNLDDINSISTFITEYYLECTKIIQDVDFASNALCCVTNNVYSSKVDDKNVIGSIVWGLIRSIQLELKDEKIILVDTDSKYSSILNVIENCINSKVSQVLYYEGALKTLNISNVITDDSQNPYTFTSDKSYIVIGGFGALGVEACKYMINSGAKKIIVIGRSNFEDKKEIYNNLLNMEEGLIIDYYQMDVSLKGTEKKIVDILLKEKLIGGIVYAAGVVKDKSFINYKDEDIQVVYKSKINGVFELSKALNVVEFDFAVIYSSIVGVIGAAGQSVYGAANCFLDSFSAYMKEKGKNVFTIQWGPWADSGMFSKVDERGVKRYEERNIFAMNTNEAMKGFAITLNSGSNQMVVRFKENKNKNVMPQITYEEICNNTEKSVKDKVKEIIANAIGVNNINSINDNQSLIDLGIDSLLMIEIRMKINKFFKVKLSLEEFFDGMTIEGISKKIEEN